MLCRQFLAAFWAVHPVQLLPPAFQPPLRARFRGWRPARHSPATGSGTLDRRRRCRGVGQPSGALGDNQDIFSHSCWFLRFEVEVFLESERALGTGSVNRQGKRRPSVVSLAGPCREGFQPHSKLMEFLVGRGGLRPGRRAKSASDPTAPWPGSSRAPLPGLSTTRGGRHLDSVYFDASCLACSGYSFARLASQSRVTTLPLQSESHLPLRVSPLSWP